MTAVQLNAKILRNLGAIAEDESMLKRVAKYLRKLVSEKEADQTLLSKEEFDIHTAKESELKIVD